MTYNLCREVCDDRLSWPPFPVTASITITCLYLPQDYYLEGEQPKLDYTVPCYWYMHAILKISAKLDSLVTKFGTSKNTSKKITVPCLVQAMSLSIKNSHGWFWNHGETCFLPIGRQQHFLKPGVDRPQLRLALKPQDSIYATDKLLQIQLHR